MGRGLCLSGANGSFFTLNDPDEDEGNRFGYAVAGLGDVTEMDPRHGHRSSERERTEE